MYDGVAICDFFDIKRTDAKIYLKFCIRKSFTDTVAGISHSIDILQEYSYFYQNFDQHQRHLIEN